MLEQLIVYGAVVCAATYVTWRLLPGVLRDAFAERYAGLAQRLGLAPVTTPDQGSSRRSSGCGGCTGCAAKNAPRHVAMIKNIKNRSHADAN